MEKRSRKDEGGTDLFSSLSASAVRMAIAYDSPCPFYFPFLITTVKIVYFSVCFFIPAGVSK